MSDPMNEPMSTPRSDPAARAAALRLALMYQGANALYVAVTLGIPDLIAAGRNTVAAIAAASAADPGAVRRLLRGLAAFDVVLQRGPDAFVLTAVGETLRSDVAHSARPVVLMFGNEQFREMSASLGDCVRTGKNAFALRYGRHGSFAYLADKPELAAIFDAGMSAVSVATGPALARAYDFSAVEHVIDVGGGRGMVLAALLTAHAHLRASLFELARVIERVEVEMERFGPRFAAIGGDMFETVPPGADCYLLSHIIHDWDDARAVMILTNCRRAMPKGARLLILDRVMPEIIEASPLMQGNVMLDLTMLVRTDGGRERTRAEFEAILAAAGLRLSAIYPLTVTPDSVLEAKPI
jgi:hypothetical protein